MRLEVKHARVSRYKAVLPQAAHPTVAPTAMGPTAEGSAPAGINTPRPLLAADAPRPLASTSSSVTGAALFLRFLKSIWPLCPRICTVHRLPADMNAAGRAKPFHATKWISRTCKHARALIRANANTHTPMHARSHARTHARARANTHARAHARTRASATPDCLERCLAGGPDCLGWTPT